MSATVSCRGPDRPSHLLLVYGAFPHRTGCHRAADGRRLCADGRLGTCDRKTHAAGGDYPVCDTGTTRGRGFARCASPDADLPARVARVSLHSYPYPRGPWGATKHRIVEPLKAGCAGQFALVRHQPALLFGFPEKRCCSRREERRIHRPRTLPQDNTFFGAYC